MTQRIKLTIEYDGADFRGWQAQQSGGGDEVARTARTVQGALELGLRKLTRAQVRVYGASRTDAGVHAAGQVAHFDWPEGFELPAERAAAAINAYLPKDMAVVEAEPVPSDFHAQHSATGKIYRYAIVSRAPRAVLQRRTHWHVSSRLSLEAMRVAAKPLVGANDLSSFATELHSTQEKRRAKGLPPLQTVRDIRRIDIISAAGAAGPSETSNGPQADSEVFVEVEGTGFLYKMVRTIVGTLVEVGRGAQPSDWIDRVIASRDRGQAGPTAPAHGLCLLRVLYG